MRIIEKGITGSEKLENQGIHLMAYYYSLEHMLLKCAVFIKQGLEQRERCFVSLEPEHCAALQMLLPRFGIDMEEVWQSQQIQFVNFQDMYSWYLDKGMDGLVQAKRGLLVQSLADGFSGVRCIWDTRWSLLVEGVETYFALEKILDQAVQMVPFTCLCLIDVERLLDKDNEEVSRILEHLIECHGFLFTENQVIKSETLKMESLKE